VGEHSGDGRARRPPRPASSDVIRFPRVQPADGSRRLPMSSASTMR
jgi:hypothetical protein